MSKRHKRHVKAKSNYAAKRTPKTCEHCGMPRLHYEHLIPEDHDRGACLVTLPNLGKQSA